MTTSTPHGRPLAMRRFWESDWSLTTLLALLAFYVFFLEPLHMVGYGSEILSGLAFTVMLVSGIATVAETHSRRTWMPLALVAIVSTGAHWARVLSYSPAREEMDAVASIVILAMLAGIVLAQVFREGPITSARIQGAIAVYLLVALMFAAIYQWIALHNPTAFTGALPGADISANPLQRFTYFSLVTLTTLGYGDVVPMLPFARSMATLEAFIGQIFPAILLARLVSMEVYYRQVTGFRGRAGKTEDH